MFCRQCGKNNEEDAKFCIGCGAATGTEPVKTQQNTPPEQVRPDINTHVGNMYTPPPIKNRKKKRIIPIIAALLAVAVIVAAVVFVFFRPEGTKLVLGKESAKVSTVIDSTGGKYQLLKDSSVLTDLYIDVPAGAYDSQKTFTISTTEVKKHNFGELFEPVTPLITIDNRHEFASKPMSVTIPVSIGADEFAMGFYYDRNSGKLEAIPISAYNE